MLRFIAFTLVITFLVACAPTSVEATVTATITVIFTPSPIPAATETLTPKPTLTSTPLREFLINREATKYSACDIPAEAILDKSFVDYLKTLVWPAFNEAKLKFRKLARRTSNVAGDQIVYAGVTAPNYPDLETRPYQREVFCRTTFGGVEYAVAPVRYYVKGMDPKDYPWVVGLIYLGPEEYMKTEEGKANAQTIMRMYMEEMNFPIYDTTSLIYPDASTGLSPLPDPLPTAVFALYPDIQERIDAFIAGDPTALDGVALSIEVYSFGRFNK